jgi:phosphate-selective porin OprO/OprP
VGVRIAAVAVLTVCLATVAARSAAAQGIVAAQSDGGANQLVVSGLVQVDGFPDAAVSPDGRVSLQKLRPVVTATLAKRFDVRVMRDFADDTAQMMDVYADVRLPSGFRIRTGKDKTPVGYEFMLGTGTLLFPERSLATSLAPGRDYGVQLQHERRDGRTSAAVGVFNGIRDGKSAVRTADVGRGKDVAGRIVVRPFWTTAGRRRLRGLGAQIGGSVGGDTGAPPSYKTSFGQTYFSYAANAHADGARRRLATALFYYSGPLGVFTEYLRSAERISSPAASTRLANHAYDVTGSLVVTGEAASERGVRPRAAFDPRARHWGALQVIARYSTLATGRTAFEAGVTSASASPSAREAALGVNWYPTSRLKYLLMFERTTFASGPAGRRAPERALQMRAQLAF